MQFIRERFPNFPDKVLLIIFPKLYAFTGRMVSTEVKKKQLQPHGLLCMKLPGTTEKAHLETTGHK